MYNYTITHADGSKYHIDADSYDKEDGHFVFRDEEGNATYSFHEDTIDEVGPYDADADRDESDESDAEAAPADAPAADDAAV